MKCERLEVWKRASALSAEIYIYFREFKDFGFKDQICRSGLSIPSNIAEGMERESAKEKQRFLDISHASCAELKTQTYIGMKIEYIDKQTGMGWLNEIEELARMISGLKKSLDSKC